MPFFTYLLGYLLNYPKLDYPDLDNLQEFAIFALKIK